MVKLRDFFVLIAILFQQNTGKHRLENCEKYTVSLVHSASIIYRSQILL